VTGPATAGGRIKQHEGGRDEKCALHMGMWDGVVVAVKSKCT